jgi:hypothetical protein
MQSWLIGHIYKKEDYLYKVLFDKKYRPEVYQQVIRESQDATKYEESKQKMFDTSVSAINYNSHTYDL